jgi:hypothetical protein
MLLARLLVIAITSVSTLLPGADDQTSGPDPAVMELMRPGPEHQHLGKHAGTWEVKYRHWMKPDSQPMEAKGTSTIKPIFDGRFMEEEFTSEWMGKPFTGKALYGYDRVGKHYVSTWYDSMGTGIVYMTGVTNDSGRTITFTGNMSCPEDGKTTRVRQVHNHISDNEMLIDMYETKDGKERKTMELKYQRRQ